MEYTDLPREINFSLLATLLESESSNPAVIDFILQLLRKTFGPKPDKTLIRNWFEQFFIISEEYELAGPPTFVLRSLLRGTPLFVVKYEGGLVEDELKLGLALNQLRSLIPNFLLTFGSFDCYEPIGGNEEAFAICRQERPDPPSGLYIIQEFIPGIILKDFLQDARVEDFAPIFFQVLYALRTAYRSLGFSHHDLHDRNVMIRPHEPINLRYETERGIEFLPTNRLAVIIDFEHGTLGNEEQPGEPHLMFSTIPYPIKDIFFLLYRSYPFARDPQLRDLIRTLLSFFLTDYDAYVVAGDDEAAALERPLSGSFEEFIPYARSIIDPYLQLTRDPSLPDYGCQPQGTQSCTPFEELPSLVFESNIPQTPVGLTERLRRLGPRQASREMLEVARPNLLHYLQERKIAANDLLQALRDYQPVSLGTITSDFKLSPVQIQELKLFRLQIEFFLRLYEEYRYIIDDYVAYQSLGISDPEFSASVNSIRNEVERILDVYRDDILLSPSVRIFDHVNRERYPQEEGLINWFSRVNSGYFRVPMLPVV